MGILDLGSRSVELPEGSLRETAVSRPCNEDAETGVGTAEKSNEITAIPTLLSLIDIQGAIITIDAMGTQTAIAEKIIDGGGDFILALPEVPAPDLPWNTRRADRRWEGLWRSWW